jgi:signal transduction histidine kinase
VTVAEWVERVLLLGYGARTTLVGGPEVSLRADPDQLDALLINLLKNAVEASPAEAKIVLRWHESDALVTLLIDDEGPGVAEASSLFVPFFTTKPGGTGIGLALARQIAEAHGGEVDLRTRESGRGARASVVLPVA